MKKYLIFFGLFLITRAYGNAPATTAISAITVTQYTIDAFRGSVDSRGVSGGSAGARPVIQIAMTFINAGAGLERIDDITCNTNGTTSTGDLLNARLYYTGTSSTFSTAVQYGSTIASPSGAMFFNDADININAAATHYFWLTYDISTTATIGNLIDAECTNGTFLLAGTFAPGTPNPAGARSVSNICTVTSTADGTTTDGASLRWAITETNLNVSVDEIHFDITGAGPHTITLSSALPNLSDNSGVTIDATTQTGWSANTVVPKNASAATPMNAALKVILTHTLSGVPGFSVTANNNTIKGFVIQSVGNTGLPATPIIISGNSNQVLGCIIGLDVNGTTSSNTNERGIFCSGTSSYNSIGDGTAAGANIISGNILYGVIFSTTGTGNIIKGNMIGLQKDGESLTTNGQSVGVYATNTHYNSEIGGTAAGDGNVISGNTNYGIQLTNGPVGALVAGNVIGTKASGSSIIAGHSQNIGIYIGNSANSNVIGGTTSAHKNLISDNIDYGVYIQASFGSSITGNEVKGNIIGPAIDGTSYLTGHTQNYGVYLNPANMVNFNNNIIGGTASGEGNVISGNIDYGIYLSGTPAAGTTYIKGNIIGLQSNGTSLMSTTQTNGVYISGFRNAVIGGTGTYEKNTISGNGTYGLYITGASSTGTQIKGNYIGIASNGTSFLTGNSQDYGIYLSTTAPATTIGGTNAGEGNVISGNNGAAYGIYLDNSGNSIYGNIIGAKASGATTLDALNNQAVGIYINNKANNIIGGTSSAFRNVISDNTFYGIYITGASATGTQIKGNYIGVATNGTSLITGHSQNFGVYLHSDAASTTIGGTNSGDGNVISGNTSAGIYAIGASRLHNIFGNYIGPAASGANSLGASNQTYGIYIDNAPQITIGGTSANHRNIISDNGTNGIYITGASATGIQIKGNYIGLASNGTSIITSATQNRGILITGSSTGNTIGGTNTGEGNVISGNDDGANGGLAVLIESTSSQNTVIGNIVGPQKDGSTLLASSLQVGGVLMQGNNNVVGGSTTAARNIISGNTSYGAGFAVGSTGNTIKGNYIGLASDGTTFIAGSSQDYGVISFGNNNTIGGTVAGEGNLISGNSNAGGTGYGIWAILGNGTAIYGNIIGPQKDGSTYVTNNLQDHGIYLSIGTYNNTIGGSTSNHRNIISANNVSGIYLSDAGTSGNVIKGNYIGLQSNGTSTVASSSQDYGVYITSSASNNIIGGTNAGEGNVISGNDNGSSKGIGIKINSTNAIGNYTYANIIGLQANGSSFLTNNQDTGIVISNSPNNVIGGSSSAFKNVISGNGSAGVYIVGSGSTGNSVKGNHIGLNSVGNAVIASATQDKGVHIGYYASGNNIGGTNAGEGNVISGNSDAAIGGATNASGVYLDFFSANTGIYGNIIGLQADGASYLTSNEQEIGILGFFSSNINIGGNGANYRNVISGNELYGNYCQICSNLNIKGNIIGLASDGSSFVTGSTQARGIYSNSNSNVTIGGSVAGDGNILSGQEDPFNGDYGIYFEGGSAITVQNNVIGLQEDRMSLVSGTPQAHGIQVNSSPVNLVIGGSNAVERNIISGNNFWGVTIFGLGTGFVLKGNYIGVGSDGDLISGSGQERGIAIGTGAKGAVIGGTNAGEGNVISGNTDYGITMAATSSVGNGYHELYGNIIGPKASGTTSIGAASNQTYGIEASNIDFLTIGGSTSGHRNVISDNGTYGIYITGALAQPTENLKIQGNYIGIAADGISQITSSSQDYGIYLSGYVSNSQVGGTAGAGSSNPQGNTIAYNTNTGLYITGANATGIMVSKNVIYGNTTMAINNVSSGNAEYAVPVVNTSYNATTVTGTSSANDIIDVFKKVAGGANHCQQAQQYLGTTTANGSGAWSFAPGGTILNAGETPLATARSSTNNNTSEFNCPSTAIGLPIELLYFNAEKINETSVKTYWQTATEINNDFFTIEASSDPSKGGETWLVVGTVAGAGNSSVVLNYQLFDNNITQYSAHSTLYYRLKQTDFDGSYSYSQIVAVDLNKNNSSISNFNIYPNPTTGDNINITITGEVNSEVIIIVRDVLGKELYAKTFIIDNSTTTIQLSDGFSLASGVYTVIASNKNTFVSKKVAVR